MPHNSSDVGTIPNVPTIAVNTHGNQTNPEPETLPVPADTADTIEYDEHPVLLEAEHLLRVCGAFEHHPITDALLLTLTEDSPPLCGMAQFMEGAAAVCMTAFGQEMVPSLEPFECGAPSQTALLIARAYLQISGPYQVALEAIAVLAYRALEQARQQEQEGQQQRGQLVQAGPAGQVREGLGVSHV